jgi:hypothetical protein
LLKLTFQLSLELSLKFRLSLSTEFSWRLQMKKLFTTRRLWNVVVMVHVVNVLRR